MTTRDSVLEPCICTERFVARQWPDKLDSVVSAATMVAMIAKNLSLVCFLGSSILWGCGTTPQAGYCELPMDCPTGQYCFGNICQDEESHNDAAVTIDAGPPPTVAAMPTLAVQAIKTFEFTWVDVEDATHYKLLENIDGSSEFVQVGQDIESGEQAVGVLVPLFGRGDAEYVLQTCNGGGCIDSAPIGVGSLQEGIGYVKGDVPGRFGRALAMSADGKTLVVGTETERVYVFTRDGLSWSRQAMLQATNTEAGDGFGRSVAISADGATLAVGAKSEKSLSSGIGGVPNNDGVDVGAAYVFAWDGASWNQQAYVKSNSPASGNTFGSCVAVSGDGGYLTVGSPRVAGDGLVDSGVAYVFKRSGAVWQHNDLVRAGDPRAGDRFGEHCALSADGSTLVMGATRRNSAAGAAYVFANSGTEWQQQASLQASNPTENALFGHSLALSDTGDVLAVGARDENSTEFASGAAYVFARSGTSWSEDAYVKASNTGREDGFGVSVALSADGKLLSVGASGERSNAIGVDADETNNSSPFAGAVYVFAHDAQWSQLAYLKASNTDQGDAFGFAVALSGDGYTLAVGAFNEDGGGTGIGGDQSDNTSSSAGAVYLY